MQGIISLHNQFLGHGIGAAKICQKIPLQLNHFTYFFHDEDFDGNTIMSRVCKIYREAEPQKLDKIEG